MHKPDGEIVIHESLMDRLRPYLTWAIPILMLTGLVGFCVNLERAGTSGKVRIRYMIWGSSPETTDMFRDVVTAFEKDNPDIDVELLVVPWNAYHRKIFTMVAANSKLDVMRLSSGYFQQLLARNSIFCIEDYVRRDVEEVDVDDFWEGALEGCKKDGKLYGIPIQAYPWGFYYNKDLFKEAGVEPPDYTWTWQGKFLDAARRLTKRNQAGRVTQFGCQIPTYADAMMRMIYMNGGAMLNEDNSKCVFNSKETRQVIQFVYDLIKVYQYAPLPEQQQNQNLFKAGKVAMMPRLRSEVPYFRKQLAFDWDVGPTPRWEDDNKKQKPWRVGTGGSANPTTIYVKSEHPREACRFLKYLTGKKAALIIAKSGRYAMARRSAAESKEFLDTTPPEHNKYFLDEPRDAIKVYRPPFPYYSERTDIFQDNFHHLLEGKWGAGKAAVVKYCETVQAEMNKLIAEKAALKAQKGGK